jgi:hypothetical protein
MQLPFIDLLNGIFSLIGLIIAIIIGLKLISKYFRYKRRDLFLIGLVFILLPEPWWPSNILFLSLILTGYYLKLEIILLIGNIFLPITTLLWLIVFNDLLDYKRKKEIYGIFIVQGILFEIFLFYYLFTNPSIIGEISGNVDVNYGLFASLYHLTILIVAIITGTLFARECWKSNDPKTRLKGKLIFAAVYSFVVGSILDILSASSIILLTLARIILILASIELYGGFILPNWMQKIFLKG